MVGGRVVARPAVQLPRVPPLAIADGSLEALKWLALVLMTADHVNKFLYHGTLPGIYEAGRTVLPLFAFVLGYNLARPGMLADGAFGRAAKRLAAYGFMATPPFVALVGWWPLNVLFTLLLAALVVWLLERGTIPASLVALAIFCVGGAFVEFWWFGAACCVAAWAYCRRPSAGRTLVWSLCLASLSLVNGNLWALAALPLILAARHVRLVLPRWRNVFYVYYPLHLIILLIAQRVATGSLPTSSG